jgi:hypothetical protein
MLLVAAWLLVVGYGLVYIGYSNLNGKSVSFADAFGFGTLIPKAATPSPSPTGSVVPTGGTGVSGRLGGPQQ